jgi:replicative DNA helicase
MASLLQNSNPELFVATEQLANIEAEQAVLGALLVNNEAMLYIGQLRSENFYEPLHQQIFAVICDWFDKGQTVNPLTLKTIFTADYKYLNNLAVNASLVKDISTYYSIIMDYARRRRMRDIFQEGQVVLSDFDNYKAEDIAITASQKLQKSLSDADSKMFQNDAEVIESVLNDLKSDVTPYQTGYEKLDTAMAGGLYPGKSYGFAARKKLGKTILAGCISQNLNEKGVRHLFICGEMSPSEVHKRTLGRLMRVKSGAFYDAGRNSLAFQQAIAAHAITSKKNIIYKNAQGLTFEDLKRYVLLARMQKKITGFILDYWQLVGGKRKGQSTAEHLDEVAQWVADTCRKYDLWSIVMAQINQEGNTRGGEGIRLAFDQVYVLRAPDDDAGRSERWLEMSDTRYTQWRSVGSEKNPGFYLNEHGPHFSATYGDDFGGEL